MSTGPQRVKLTEAYVRELSFAEGSKYVVRDTEIKGFMVVVSKRAKSWAVQRDLWQGPRGNRRLVRTVRHTLGRAGIMPLRIAREKALEAISLIQQGVDPNHYEPAPELTLEGAWNDYVEAMIARGRAERSIYDFKYNLRYFADWRKITLTEIGDNRSLVRERHKDITRKNGSYAANRAMRALRAAYNLALKVDDSLPANPVIAVVFNKESRREAFIAPSDLPGWWERVHSLANPIRRDLHLFLLLTGLRRTSAVTARWEHVNWEEARLLVPNPKGGKERAFELPLSRYVVKILKRRQRENNIAYPGSPWIWPAGSSTGHVTEPKESKNGLPPPHVLRHTYSSFAKAAGLHETDIALLLNHKLPGVTGGYIHGGAVIDHLAECQERIAAHILELTQSDAGSGDYAICSSSGRGDP